MLTDSELRSIRDSVDRLGRLSDGLIRIGPFNFGIDAVLSWIPAVGELYNAGAGVFILVQGARAGVPVTVLAQAGAVLGLRTLGDSIPFAGPLFADVFTAHRWAAKMVVQAIDRRLGAAVQPVRAPLWRRRAAASA
jgi:hypothetical protein